MSNIARFQQVFDFAKIRRYLVVAGIPAGLFYGVALVGLWSAGFSIMEILRDPAQQSGQSSFLGFLSNIGVWLWVSSAAICFSSAAGGTSSSGAGRRELILLVGALSLLLAVDDFFLIHDRYLNQRICYLAYAVFACSLLLRHHKEIIEAEGFAFLLAGTLLALSILTDLTQRYIPLHYAYVQVFEEGFKFTGAATWLYFSCRMTAERRPARAPG